MLRLIRVVLLAAFMLAMVGPSATSAVEPTHANLSSSLCAPPGSAAAECARDYYYRNDSKFQIKYF